ncbi:MAG: sulfite exporter TauE/SafE family protein [Planctomycetota bacterium]
MTVRAFLLLLTGASIAFVGAICGIGGGLFAVPMLHYAFRLPLRPAVATSLCLVAATAWSSTFLELVRSDSAFLWDVVLPLVGGALVGAQFGYGASKRLDERFVKGLFAVVLTGVGLRMLLTSGVAPEPAPFHESYSVTRAAIVAGIGMLAGTVSPLLGIGGGLVVVPGLLLALPEIGGLGARAASLGVACVTSARSIQLYAREKAIDARFAVPIAIGALVGASTGVHVVHLPGVSEVGQRVLGGILLLTAVRFATDVVRARSRILADRGTR